MDGPVSGDCLSDGVFRLYEEIVSILEVGVLRWGYGTDDNISIT